VNFLVLTNSISYTKELLAEIKTFKHFHYI